MEGEINLATCRYGDVVRVKTDVCIFGVGSCIINQHTTEGQNKDFYHFRARLDLQSLYLSTYIIENKDEATMFYWKHSMMQDFLYQFSEHIQRSCGDDPKSNRQSVHKIFTNILWLPLSQLQLWAEGNLWFQPTLYYTMVGVLST